MDKYIKKKNMYLYFEIERYIKNSSNFALNNLDFFICICF